MPKGNSTCVFSELTESIMPNKFRNDDEKEEGETIVFEGFLNF